MADTLLTIGMITRETLMVLSNNLVFTKYVDRKFDDQFGRVGEKIGSTLNIRKPVRFTNTTGQGIQLQDLTETSVPLVLNTQYQRAFNVTSQDLALNIDDFKKRFVDKAIISMANQIDADGMAQFINIYSEVGTPGTPLNTADQVMAATRVLDDNDAPTDPRYFVMSPLQNATLVPALTGLFNPQAKIGGQYSKGLMGKDTLGFDMYRSQSVASFLTGPQGGTPAVNGLTQSGSSIITNGWTAAAALRLRKGDIITFAGVFAVNPQTKQSTTQLAQWLVTADVSSDGAGNATIPISGPSGNGVIGPSLVVGVPSSPFQNVTRLPTTGDLITVQGQVGGTTSQRGLAFAEEAFAFACTDLPLYGGLDQGYRAKDKDLNMSIRVIRDYDINMDRAPLRCDLLGGWATIYPELAVRVTN